MQLPKLNFPNAFDFKLRKNKDKFFIYDETRKSWYLLTPEEWVRQHWVHYYLYEKRISASRLIIERKIELNGLTKRIDLLVTKRTKATILVECKAPGIKLSTATFEQIARYNSVIDAEKIILSNGLHHIIAQYDGNGYQFLPFEEFN